jgi:hypothetical protein
MMMMSIYSLAKLISHSCLHRDICLGNHIVLIVLGSMKPWFIIDLVFN